MSWSFRGLVLPAVRYAGENYTFSHTPRKIPLLIAKELERIDRNLCYFGDLTTDFRIV